MAYGLGTSRATLSLWLKLPLWFLLIFPMAANGATVAIGRIVPAIPALAGAQSKARKRVGASWPFFLVETFHAERTVSCSEFVPTKFSTAQDKADFGNTFLHFIESEWARTAFSKSFYNRLSMCFSHIAHYDAAGFYATWFTTDADRLRFLRHTLPGRAGAIQSSHLRC